MHPRKQQRLPCAPGSPSAQTRAKMVYKKKSEENAEENLYMATSAYKTMRIRPVHRNAMRIRQKVIAKEAFDT
jgi:hypothetical protein